MTDQALTKENLDTVGDADIDAGADSGGDKTTTAVADDKSSVKADDKGSDNLFDTGDDVAGDKAKPAAKGDKVAADKTADTDAEAGEKAKPDDKPKDDKVAEGDWRKEVGDKLLAPLKDKLTAAKFAKREEAIAKQLGRYKTPADAIAAGVLAQEKLRAGNKRPDDPDEAADWLKANNIPEAPEKYAIPEVPGYTWSDADTPKLDALKQVAHAHNLSQAQVNALVDWKIKDDMAGLADYEANQKKIDRADKTACHDAIRTEFGVGEFKGNMSVMQRLIEDDEVFGGTENAQRIMSARFFDEETKEWRRLTSIPAVARGLIGLALERYGEGAAMSGDGRVSASANRLEELDKIMKTDYQRYMREGLADEAMKLRMAEEERATKRAARR